MKTRRNGPVMKSVESVLRSEWSHWWERFVKEVGSEPWMVTVVPCPLDNPSLTVSSNWKRAEHDGNRDWPRWSVSTSCLLDDVPELTADETWEHHAPDDACSWWRRRKRRCSPLWIATTNQLTLGRRGRIQSFFWPDTMIFGKLGTTEHSPSVVNFFSFWCKCYKLRLFEHLILSESVKLLAIL